MITTKVVLLIINYKFNLFYTIILIGQISSIIYKAKKIGRVAELVDALVLGTNMATCEGSSPFSPTTKNYESNNSK